MPNSNRVLQKWKKCQYSDFIWNLYTHVTVHSCTTASTPCRPFSGRPVQFQSPRCVPPLSLPPAPTPYSSALQCIPHSNSEGRRASNGFFEGTSQQAKGQQAAAAGRGKAQRATSTSLPWGSLSSSHACDFSINVCLFVYWWELCRFRNSMTGGISDPWLALGCITIDVAIIVSCVLHQRCCSRKYNTVQCWLWSTVW